jgi:hypothetical protein
MPRLVIIGAGLGGCVLAEELIKNWDVVMIEFSGSSAGLDKIDDIGIPSITTPHNSFGLGGTTRVWHNGLIEINKSVFDEKWPFPKKVLAPFYDRAFQKLSDLPNEIFTKVTNVLRGHFNRLGLISTVESNPIYYPNKRHNLWEKFNLRKKVKLIRGEVVDFKINDKFQAESVVVRGENGSFDVEFDVLVVAAGGLGTPILLQRIAHKYNLTSLSNAGKYYEDHPSCFVADIQLNKPVYKFWNYSNSALNGKLRLPIVVQQGEYLVAFQIRPAAHFNKRKKLKSVISELRNHPLKLTNYFKLLFHIDDILDILSFRFGINFPTKNYSLLMVAEQPSKAEVSITFDEKNRRIVRNWQLDDSYIKILHQSIDAVLAQLGDIVTDANVYEDLSGNMFSSSHHSGTARISQSPEDGVCDINLKVHDLSNVYICDGSAIPASGYSNTGLTIAALAIRLADYLKGRYGSE